MIRIVQLSNTLANVLDGIRKNDKMYFAKFICSKEAVSLGRLLDVDEMTVDDIRDYAGNDRFALVAIEPNGKELMEVADHD